MSSDLVCYMVICGNCGKRVVAEYVNDLAYQYAEHMRNIHDGTTWHIPAGARMVPSSA